MATYFSTSPQPKYSTGQSPKEAQFSAFKTVLEFVSRGFTFAILILNKLKHPVLTAQKSVFSSITSAFGYLDGIFDLFELFLVKSIDLKKIADKLVSVSTFVLARIGGIPSFVGSIMGSVWSFLQPIPFYIAMLFHDDPTKKEKLFYHGMKRTQAAIIGAVVGMALILVGIFASPIVAIVISGIFLLPVIKAFVQNIVIPALKLIVKEAVLPLVKAFMGERLYSLVGTGLSLVKKGVTSFFKNLVQDNKHEEETVTVEKVKKTQMKNISNAIFTVGQSTSSKVRSYTMIDCDQLQTSIEKFDLALSAPTKNENQKFDYFRYVVKDKRPLSALLQDIVIHRKLIEADMAPSSFLSDRLQYSKRLDKVQVLTMLESFLLQWHQFQSTPSVPGDKKAFIIGGKDSLLVSLPFDDLSKDRDKIVKKFNDYLRDKYPSAMQSVLFRGKVETLINEAYAWIKRPTVTDIQGKIDAYTKKNPDSNPKVMTFLSSLLTLSDAMLVNSLQSQCTVDDLVLTRDEVTNPAKKAALQSKIERHMVNAYPDFVSSITSRGERYSLLQAVMRHIYFYESNQAALQLVAPAVVNVKQMCSVV